VNLTFVKISLQISKFYCAFILRTDQTLQSGRTKLRTFNIRLFVALFWHNFMFPSIVLSASYPKSWIFRPSTCSELVGGKFTQVKILTVSVARIELLIFPRSVLFQRIYESADKLWFAALMVSHSVDGATLSNGEEDRAPPLFSFLSVLFNVSFSSQISLSNFLSL